MLQMLDVVALMVAHPELGLSVGHVGTTVLEHDGEAFEVEFSGDDGVAYAMAAFPAGELLKLRYDADVAA